MRARSTSEMAQRMAAYTKIYQLVREERLNGVKFAR